MTTDPVVIASYARTPMGGMQGVLSAVSATQLGATAIKAAVERAGVKPDAVDQVIMGCVLPGALGQAPARQATLGAGLPMSVGATTINKVCGSGMKATMMAAEAIIAGTSDIVVAGGMESMTNAPYMLTKHRSGARLGHDSLKDSMFLDGLEDAYEPGRAMGSFAEETCTEYQFTREAQDEYALRSLSRANEAIASGAFDREIVPVEVVGRKGTETITVDEQPGKANPDKIPTLKPAFAKDGTITAANASSISDGAAALVVTRQSVAEAQGLSIAARIVSWATHSQEPAKFTSAPVPAIRSAMEKAGWTVADVDLFEVNEAFAMVPMIAMKELGIPAEKLNVNGGGTALGHPIGASGARIIATLIAALQNRGLKRGIASLCIGGGEGTAIAVEIA
ncbi:MAG: acetyl-CoA C-acyltransferase [Sphingomonadaceae bacterium]|jgi:acetyl-CoA C-acetyltransferase|nr:acetyl-CoA C-acyltransferase [Sphingomonadales bacterium]MBP7135814.1 acetyl-CoA C-acyltransferase [Sphingomonadaceae bacterium]